MELSSPVFENEQMIPVRYTCQGEDVNPALDLEKVPENTQSMILIIDDPDAPINTWVHWVVFNIPLMRRIEEDSVPGEQGMNDFGRLNYGGPCPPSGTHRYFFKIYALDCKLNLKQGATKEDIEQAMQGHVLAQAQLIGLYKKK